MHSLELQNLIEHPQESPALSLPPEILSPILSLSGHSLLGPQSLRLAHVCRQWRQVLLRHSEYWVDVVSSSKLDQETNVAFLSFILARSSPRSIRLNSTCLYPSIATILAPNWHRVVFLSVTVLDEDQLRALHAILQQPSSSSLHTLLVASTSTNHDLYKTCLATLPHSTPPALRRLHCPIIYLPYIAASSLCHLEVSSWPGHPPEHDVAAQTLSRLFDSLAICTELETLSIYGPLADDIENHPQHRIVHLRRLQKLFLRENCSMRTHIILSTLSFGDTTTVNLDCYEWGHMIGLHEVLSHTRPSADAVCMTIRDARILTLDLLESGTPRVSAQFNARFQLPAEISRAFAAQPSIITLECSFEGKLPPPQSAAYWAMLLPGFPALTCLTVRRYDLLPLASGLAFALHPTGVAPPLAELTVAWHAGEMADALGAAGATSSTRVNTVAKALTVALARRAEHGHMRPLARVELVEHDLSAAAGAACDDARAPVQEIEEVLAPLRELVHGPVKFKEMAGPIA